MTKEEMEEMIGRIVEEKLIELIGNPDESLAIRTSLRDRLLRQKQAVAKGERGQWLDDVERDLGLT
jgi:hypothetical protein